MFLVKGDGRGGGTTFVQKILFSRYRVNYRARDRPEKFQGFREMHARALSFSRKLLVVRS